MTLGASLNTTFDGRILLNSGASGINPVTCIDVSAKRLCTYDLATWQIASSSWLPSDFNDLWGYGFDGALFAFPGAALKFITNAAAYGVDGIPSRFNFGSLTNGEVTARNSSEYEIGVFSWITTTDENNIDVRNINRIENIDFASLETDTAIDTDIRVFVSFDGRSTWSYWNGAGWSTTTLSDINFDANGNTAAELEQLTDADWAEVGGFATGSTSTLDFAIGMKTDSQYYTPVLRDITLTFTPQYTTSVQTVTNDVGPTFQGLISFDAVYGVDNTGTVEFQISNDGVTWYYHDGANWVADSGQGYPSETNSDIEINSSISQFVGDVGPGDFYWRAFLVNNDQEGQEFVQLQAVNVGYSPITLTGIKITDNTYNEVATFTVGDDLYFEVSDGALNTNGGSIETVEGIVTSTTGDEERITLTETSASSGVFRYGPLTTSDTDADGVLHIVGSDTITFSNYVATNNLKGLSLIKTFATPYDFGVNDFSIDLYVDDASQIDTVGAYSFNNAPCDPLVGGGLGGAPGGMLVFTTGELGDNCSINLGPGGDGAWGYFIGGDIPSLVDGAFTTLTYTQAAATDLTINPGNPGGNGIFWNNVKQVALIVPTLGNELTVGLDNLYSGATIVDDFESYADATAMFAAGYNEYDTVTRDQDTPTLEGVGVDQYYEKYINPFNVDQTDTATVNAVSSSGGSSNNSGPSVSSIDAYEVITHPDSIEYIFKDLGNNLIQTSYKFYIDGVDQTSNVAFSQNGNEGTFQEFNLLPNTSYSNRQVTANIGVNEAPARGFGENYTLANVPGAPIGNVLDDTSVKLTIDLNGNPAYTDFIIYESTTNSYLTTNGQLVSFSQADFADYASWGGSNGLTVSGLTTGQGYSFSVQARNEEGVLTAFSDATVLTPGGVLTPNVQGTMYVGINVDTGAVQGKFINGVITTFQANLGDGSALSQVINNTQALFNIFLALLVIVFATSLLTIFNSIGRHSEIRNAIRLIPLVLKKEASEFFGEFSQQSPNGMYEYSFAQHKRLHKLTRASLFSTLAVSTVKVALIVFVAIIGTGIYGTLAQFKTYTGNGQPVQRGDVLSYAVVFENIGDGPTSSLTVSTPLDPKLAYVTGSGEIGIGTEVNNITLINGVLSFDVGTLEAGEQGYVKFVTTVKDDSAYGSLISQSASINALNMAARSTNEVTNIVAEATKAPLIITSSLSVTDSTPTITGTGEPGTTVSLRIDGTIVGTATVNDSGAWFITVTNALADGTYTIRANDDVAQSTGDLTLTVDAEIIPLVISSTNSTTDTTPTISGTGEPGTTITLRIDGTIIGTTTVSSAGTWSITVGNELSIGSYSVQASDSLGRTSAIQTLTIQELIEEPIIEEPVIEEPVIEEPTTEPTPGTDEYNEIRVTSPLTTESLNPPIFGTGEPGATVSITINGVTVGTTTVDRNGNWSLVPSERYEPGAYRLVVTDVQAGTQRSLTLTIEEPLDYVPPVEETQEPQVEKSIFERLDDLVDSVFPALELQQVEVVTEQVAVPTITAISAAITLPAIAAGAFNVLPYLHLLFVEPFLGLFGKRRKKYGVIYNSLTKMPVDLAVVRLYDAETKQLVTTKITDKQGRFFMLASKGNYYVSITKPGFIYPTQYLKDQKEDAQYIDVYHGEKISVDEDGTPLTMNIPLDPKEKIAKPPKKELREYFKLRVQKITSASGIILTGIAFVIYPTLMIAVFLGIHILMYLAFRRIAAKKRPKSWGIVYDENTRKPLKHAIVRIFDTRFNKLLETYVTDGSGRYSFLVGPNTYQVVGAKEGYHEQKLDVVDLSGKSVEEAQITKDMSLKEKSDGDTNDHMHIEEQPTQDLQEQSQEVSQENTLDNPGHKEITAEQQDNLKDIDLGNL